MQASLINNTTCIFRHFSVESFLLNPMSTCFCSLSRNKGLMIWTVTLYLYAAALASSKSPNQQPWGHNRLPTCPAMYQSINLFTSWRSSSVVCIWKFSRCWWAVLEVWDSFLTGRPSMLEGMAKKGCIVWPDVCRGMCVCVCEGKKKKAREKAVRAERSGKTSVTDFSVTHAALQASGWRLIQHDDEPWWFNTGPSSRLRLLSLELSERRGNSPRLWTDTEPRWREDTWGICLFISFHMLYSLQCNSEPAQWGIKWMLHQLSEDGQSFLPPEQLTQTSSTQSGPLDRKAFLVFRSRPVDLCCPFSYWPVLFPQCKTVIK